MERMIPLPDESIRSMKLYHNDPLFQFQLRMRLLELDIALNVDKADKLLNCLAIEYMVLNGEWPRC